MSLHGDKRTAKFVRTSCWRAVVQKHGQCDLERMMDLLPFSIWQSRKQFQSAVRYSDGNPARRCGRQRVGRLRKTNGASCASMNAVLLHRCAMLKNRIDSFDAGRNWSNACHRSNSTAPSSPMHRITALTCPTDRELSPRICAEPNENNQANPKSRRT